MQMPEWFPSMICEDDLVAAAQQWEEYVHDMEIMRREGEL